MELLIERGCCEGKQLYEREITFEFNAHVGKTESKIDLKELMY